MEEFHIQWHITEICNLRCVHCYREPWRKELNIDQLKLVANKIVKFVDKLGFNEIVLTITGGEPFLKPEFYELMDFLDKCQDFNSIRRINIITNGTIVPKEQLMQIKKLDKLYISLESLTPQVNDKIRGKGNFENVLNKLSFFVKNYNVGIMTTLMKDNIEELTNNLYLFIKKLFDLGVKEILFERFIPAGEAKMVKEREEISLEEIFIFYEKISEIFDLDIRDVKRYPAIKVVNLGDNNVGVYGAECVVGKYGFAVLCDGTVYPCRRFDKEIFNFLNEDKHNKKFIDFINSLYFQNSSKSTDYYYCFATEYSKNL